MTALEEYREFTDVPTTHYLPDITLRQLADAAIAELEAERTLAKPVYSRRQLEKKLEQAEAALAERDRMLMKEYESSTPRMAGYMRWYEDLRVRAEEGSAP